MEKKRLIILNNIMSSCARYGGVDGRTALSAYSRHGSESRNILLPENIIGYIRPVLSLIQIG